MLKLSNRSSAAAATVLLPARKITEFFQPASARPLPLRLSDQGDSARDSRAARDALVRPHQDRTEAAEAASGGGGDGGREEGRRGEGMPLSVPQQQQVSPVTRKRTRDGQLVERPTRAGAAEAQPSVHRVNGDVRAHRGTVLPAASVSEKASDDGRRDGEEKRSLRSKAGGTRLKSNLATYFPNFEDVVAGVPHAPEFLTFDEPIQILDIALQITNEEAISHHVKPKAVPQQNQYDRIDIFALANESTIQGVEDPLDDEMYLPTHRRAERREKQLRNIEKERAQHEKGQLESLLDSLQGPDWLRVMGVTGITDGARKDYEPRRDYFVREVKALLRKFRIWKDAEKKLMHEKAARDEDDEDEDDDASAGAEEDMTETEDNDLSTDDADAWAARQLRIEARSAQSKASRHARPKPREKAPPKPPKPPEPPKPFTSFFEKPHLRQAALSKGRHSGRRSILAFGRPVPEPDQRDFDLPANFMSPEAMLAKARKRRRINRERKEAEAEAEAEAKQKRTAVQ